MAVGVVNAYDKYEFTTNIFLSNAKAIGRDNGTIRNANLQFVDVAPSGNIGFSFRDGGSDKVFIDGSGKLGVGTTDPTASIDTDGSIFLSTNASVVGRDNGITRNANIQFADVSPLGNSAIVVRDGGSDLMIVDGSGNVGIGTTAPKTALSTIYDYDTVAFGTQLANNEGGGEILRIGSGQAGAIGTLHFLHTDGSWNQADATQITTGGSQLLGIAMDTDPGTDGMLIRGFYRVAAANIDGTPAIGAPVYVADDPTGEFDFTAPANTDEYVRIVGFCVDITGSDILLHFNPDKTWVELA